MATDDSCAERIAKLNDQSRTNWGTKNTRVVITQGVQAFSEKEQSEVFERVRTFDDFSEDNDPHKERDFGNFTYAGQKLFWKVDYYNLELDGGSPDPADPDVTMRVLTILLASEY